MDTENKENQLVLALSFLQMAEQDLAELISDPDALDAEVARKQVAVAEANLRQAAEDLATLVDSPDPLDMQAKEKQVAVARAILANAQEELAELKSSVDPLKVSLGEAEVAFAQAALEEATQRLEDATLTSPMTGFVSMVEVEAGQTVTANTTIVEIVESTVIEVDAIVDEIDVLFVREGAQAQVTMDALPGQVLRGTVSSIAPAARNQQGVVSYPISIRLDAPEGAQLVEGLSATASIVIREDTDVLLVPNQSIYGSFEQPVIRVMKNGTIEDRPVTLGNSDDFWTVVIEGLQEGDQVVIETSGVSTDPFAQIRQQFQSGGRRGGGGFLGGDGRRR